MHLIDGEQPEYSRYDNASIRVLGPYSSFEHILAHEPATLPPVIVFGAEPEHNWCYFYQKAALARQRKAWDEIRLLGDETLAENLVPGDLIEWMPFLQAYAQLGDFKRLEELAPGVVSDPYVAQQACHLLGALPHLAQPVADVINLQYCLE